MMVPWRVQARQINSRFLPKTTKLLIKRQICQAPYTIVSTVVRYNRLWISDQRVTKLKNSVKVPPGGPAVDHELWKACLKRLEHELSEPQLSTWIRPLHAREDDGALRLLAPNRFVLDWVKKHHLTQIKTVLQELRPSNRRWYCWKSVVVRPPSSRPRLQTRKPP